MDAYYNRESMRILEGRPILQGRPVLKDENAIAPVVKVEELVVEKKSEPEIFYRCSCCRS
jgi:hypothetical protein